MKKLVKPLIASVLVIFATGAVAQSYSEDKVNKIIRTMDDNADKTVGYQEYFEETVTDSIDPLDTNRDGYVTSGEIVIEIKEDLVESIAEMRKQGISEQDINKTIAIELGTAEKEAADLIRKMDSDGDNLVEPEEFSAYKRKQFDALDKNKDGVISRKDVRKSKGFPIHQY